MSHSVKCALITAFVSKTKDRFHDYKRALELEERLALVATMQGMSGVEVIFPYETKDALHLKALLAKYRLEMAAVNVNVKAEPEFRTNIHVWVENNQGEVIFSDWRYNMPTYYEGEWVTGARAVNGRGGGLYYMPAEFDTNILWTSNGKFTGEESVKNAVSEGYGFAYFSGHGSPNVWQDQYPGLPGDRRGATIQGLWVSHLRTYPPFKSEPLWPMEELSNTGMFPITVVGGCHNSLFTVSLIPSGLNYYLRMFGIDNEMWTGIDAVPQTWSWYLFQMPNTGAIATMGNTGLGWGWEGEFCTSGAGDGWISSEFFKQYSPGRGSG